MKKISLILFATSIMATHAVASPASLGVDAKQTSTKLSEQSIGKNGDGPNIRKSNPNLISGNVQLGCSQQKIDNLRGMNQPGRDNNQFSLIAGSKPITSPALNMFGAPLPRR